jgi:hypothetical protein
MQNEVAPAVREQRWRRFRCMQEADEKQRFDETKRVGENGIAVSATIRLKWRLGTVYKS